MYNTSSHQQSHSHQSRSPIDPLQQQASQPHNHPQHYAASSLYPPAIPQQPSAPTSLYHSSGHQPGTAPAPAVYSSHPITSSPAAAPSLLDPTSQRSRSGSGSLTTPGLSAHSDPQNLRRSSSLNDTMANPQTGYYPMASQMGSYHGHPMYSQGSLPPSSYYNSLPQPQINVPIQSSYVEQPRQQPMRPVSGNYDYSHHMQYSQPGYVPNSYSTSYQPAHSMLSAQSSSPYGSQAPMAGSPASAMYNMPQRPSPPATLSGAGMHAVDRAKKPQCWDHGCNGREFSTFSNLLRHQREKSGTAQKSYCNHCGAEFTRTTARNGHMEHGKCKTRRGPGSGTQ